MLAKKTSLSGPRVRPMLLIIVTSVFLVAACNPVGVASQPAASSPPSPTGGTPTVSAASELSPAPTVSPVATNIRIDDPNDYVFAQLLPFDGILPIYEPEFASASDAPLLDEELVMGLALGGEAKAYPISVLRSREMVNDELAGIPILVTW